MKQTCYTIVVAPDAVCDRPNNENHYLTRTFAQARNAFKAARVLASLCDGGATITVVKVA